MCCWWAVGLHPSEGIAAVQFWAVVGLVYMQAGPAALNPQGVFKWLRFYIRFTQKLSTFFSAIVSRGYSGF